MASESLLTMVVHFLAVLSNVPQIDVPLTLTKVHTLHHTYDPRAPSDEGGMNIYVDVRQHIANFLSE